MFDRHVVAGDDDAFDEKPHEPLVTGEVEVGEARAQGGGEGGEIFAQSIAPSPAPPVPGSGGTRRLRRQPRSGLPSAAGEEVEYALEEAAARYQFELVHAEGARERDGNRERCCGDGGAGVRTPPAVGLLLLRPVEEHLPHGALAARIEVGGHLDEELTS